MITDYEKELIANPEEPTKITSYQMMKQYVSQLDTVNLGKDAEYDSLYAAIKHVVYNCTDKYFVMLAPKISYLTIFAKVDDLSGRKDLIQCIIQFIIDEHERLGGLKCHDYDDNAVELWIGEEYYRICPYGFAVEEC